VTVILYVVLYFLFDAVAMFFTDAGTGKTRTNAFVTLDFACYQCHTDPVSGEGGGMSQKTLAELSAKAMGIHGG